MLLATIPRYKKDSENDEPEVKLHDPQTPEEMAKILGI